MKKMLTILGAVGLTATSSSAVVSCKTEVTLKSILAQDTFDLGEIKNTEADTIIEAINRVLKPKTKLTKDNVKVEVANDKKSAKISPQGKTFTKGDITVKFTVNENLVVVTKLSDLLKVTDLKEFAKKPEASELIKKVLESNKESNKEGKLKAADLECTNIVVDKDNKGTADLKSKSKDFEGNIKLTFTVAKPKDESKK